MNKNLFKYSLLFLALITGCCENTTSKKTEKSETGTPNIVEKTTNEKNNNDLIEIPKKLFENGETFKAIELAQKPENINTNIWKSLLAYYNYWGSYNTPINRVKALELANSSKNEPLSKAVLARFYLTGFWNIEKDLDKAEKLAEESYKEGCTEGLVVLLNVLKEKRKTLYIEESKNISESEKYKISRYSMEIGEISSKLYKEYLNSNYADIRIQQISEKILARNYKNPSIALKGIVFPKNQDLNNNIKKLQGPYDLLKPYLDAKNPQAYFTLAKYEDRQNNRNSFKENLLKSIDYGYSNKLFNYYVNSERIRFDLPTGQKIAEHIIKTNNLSDLLWFYLLFNESIKVDDYLKKTLPQDIDWVSIAKSGADNGSPAFMLIYALSQKDKNDYKKYMEQAEKMGAEEFIEKLYERLPNNLKEKWLNIGLDLNNKTSFIIKAKAYFSGNLFGKKTDINIDKGLEILDKMLVCGHFSSISDMTLINIISDYNLLKIENIDKKVKEYMDKNQFEDNQYEDFNPDFDDFEATKEKKNKTDFELNQEQTKKLYIIGKVTQHPLIDSLFKEIENKFSAKEIENINKIIEEKTAKVKENIILRENKIKKYMNINEYY